MTTPPSSSPACPTFSALTDAAARPGRTTVRSAPLRRAASVLLTTVLTLALLGIAPLDAASAQQHEVSSPIVRRHDLWLVRTTPTGGDAEIRFHYGRPEDHALTGDWDGDGVATPGVYREGWFYLRNSLTGGTGDISFYYGGHPDDLPVVGDWDGDGIDTVGVVRTGRWYLVNSHRGGRADIAFDYPGNIKTGEVVVAGDWDGDGIDTPGVVRENTWYLSNTFGGAAHIKFVLGYVDDGDVPVTGDWNGDGIDTAGIVRDNKWLLLDDHDGEPDRSFTYGEVGDLNVSRGGTADHGARWWRLAYCESHQNWTYNGGSGYDGGLQFHPQTWRSYRYAWYPGYAHQATPWQQIAAARRVLMSQGWSAWPACTRKMGFR